MRASFGLFPLHQADHADNFESVFTGGCNGLNRRCSRGADIIHNHHPRTLVAEALNALSRAVLLFGLAHQKAVQFAAYDGDGYDNRVRTHRQPANGAGLPSPLPDLLEEDFPRQTRAFRIEGRRATVNVIVAGPAGRKFELTQPERLVSERAQQFLTCRIHENLRYHDGWPPAFGFRTGGFGPLHPDFAPPIWATGSVCVLT